MKLSSSKKLSLLGAVALAATLQVNAQTFTVDPSQTWLGYMNVFDPYNGNAYDFGSAWATADLDATFSGPTLTLTPNDNIDRTDPIDAYWWAAPNDGTTPGIKTMQASMYVEMANFAGGNVTFTGNVLNNSLANGYTSVAFIDDFTSGYSLVNSIQTSDLADGIFNISLNINPGDVLQYGFITTGLNARTAALPSLGNVEVVAVPEPTTLALAGLGGLAGLSLIRRRK
jgi:PEP-CTERM motif